MPLLLVFTPAPKPARDADMDMPCNQVEVNSRCGLAVFLVLNFPVQKLSNLSIKLNLGEGGHVSLPQQSQTQKLIPG